MISFLLALLGFLRAIGKALKNPESKGLAITALSLLLIGTVFYTNVEHWRALDALYFSATTLTTTGFGDFAPRSDAGKIFTILYLFLGVGVFVAFVTVIAGTTKRMKKPIAKK